MANEDPKCLTCGAPKSAHIGGRGRSIASADCLEFNAEPETDQDPDIESVNDLVSKSTAETLIPMAASLVRRLLDRRLPAAAPAAPPDQSAEVDQLRRDLEDVRGQLTIALTGEKQMTDNADRLQGENAQLQETIAQLRADRAEPGDVADALDRLVGVLREQIAVNAQVLDYMRTLKPPQDPQA